MRQDFIQNLKKYRKIEGVSQMRLAEMCDTDASYIGQIEIGSRFPSIELIEKMAQALAIEPYRFFMKELDAPDGDGGETLTSLAGLPLNLRLNLINRLTAALGDCVKAALTP
jgi:transcriptional regulator with XRE-family HTH domain